MTAIVGDSYQAVDSVKIIKNRFNGRSRGYGFVEMPSNSEADKAIKALNGNMINKKPLIIKQGDSGGKKKKKSLREEVTDIFFEGRICLSAVRGRSWEKL